VAQGKGQPHTSQKIQICDELGFFGPNSEYAYVNFFHIYFDFSDPRFDYKSGWRGGREFCGRLDKGQHIRPVTDSRGNP
jgi:hypothetical protein